jgi:hypothetical protein
MAKIEIVKLAIAGFASGLAFVVLLWLLLQPKINFIYQVF